MRNTCGNKKIATPIKSDDLFGNAVSVLILPGRIRTYDLMVRSHALYPAGLRAEEFHITTKIIADSCRVRKGYKE